MTCTTPLLAVISTAMTSAWFKNTSPEVVAVSLSVLSVLNGCTIAPLVTAKEGTSVPSTWYKRISDNSGTLSNSGMVIPI